SSRRRHTRFSRDWSSDVCSSDLWTTLPAILILLGLLTAGWQLRTRSPLFSLGILLFFSAHFIASNVIGLELAYEHRNHFALIGAVLALGSLLAQTSCRVKLRPAVQAGLCLTLLVALGGTTLLRAHNWRNSVSLAEASTLAAPGSPRAWIQLCDARFNAGGG